MGRQPHIPSPPDYYSVLKVPPGASLEEIRASFKRLVLKVHPDKNPGKEAWSERAVRRLIEAFEVLTNPQRRAAFDRQRVHREPGATAAGAGPRAGQRQRPEPFFFRKTDQGSRALLILHLLLHRRPRAALEFLREMELKWGGDYLSRNLAREDFLDSLFLIAEFHAKRKEYRQAAERLRAFYVHEKGSKYPRHYLDEVVRRLKDLYLRKIPKVGGADEALRGLREARELGLTGTEEAFRLRRMAEVLLDKGNAAEARRVFERALRLFPLSKETERIRKKMSAAGRVSA